MSDNPNPTPSPQAPPEQHEADMPIKFSPEEIALAQQELDNMTPESYLGLRAFIASIEESMPPEPEDRAIIFTELVSKTGAAFNLTVRHPVSPILAIDALALALKYAGSKYGLKPVIKHPHLAQQSAPTQSPTPQAQSSQSAVSQTSGSQLAGPQPSAPAGKKEPVYTQEGSQDNSGTSELNSVTSTVVKGKHVVQFDAGKFKYPFSDYRGAKAVAALFDAELGWDEKILENPGVWTKATWGGFPLYVDWEKKDKYYNVLRVHR